MTELKDIFALEAEREMPESWNKVHLYKVGDFWRAYEWSAWLVAVITYNDEVRMQTKDRKPLHVTRMRRTDVEGATYCTVGFPIRSLDKFIPQRENFESKEDFHAVVTITLPQPSDGSAITHDRLAEAVERWKETIGLELHQGKIHIQEVHKGVEFLGTFVKPYREYVSNKTLERMQKKLQQVDLRNREAALRSVNSYLGLMSHTASYNLRRSMFGEGEFAGLIEYDADMRKGWLAA